MTGKSTSSNASVYAVNHLVGSASVSSASWAGSAVDEVPNLPAAPPLFAWKVARDCPSDGGVDPQCLEIPGPGCPTGLATGALGFFAFRAYLEPSGNTGPDPATLIRDRVLKFTHKQVAAR